MSFNTYGYALINYMDRNNRIYKKEELEKCFAEKNNYFGIIGYRIGTSVELEKLSHICRNFYCTPDRIEFAVEVLDTPMGLLLQGLYNNTNLPIFGISATGILNIDGGKTKVSELQVFGFDVISE